MSDLDHLRDAVRLQEEVRELQLRLFRAVEDATGDGFTEEMVAEFLDKVERFRAAVAAAYPQQRERTSEELALLAFTDRRVARQGTFMQDFDALYRRKAELDGED
jgi:hypothetical protein